ncbi:hypothetical protein F0562_002845 [Nyssa sinensis]|uniref:Delta-aminolevulinic acid dehydratase n=1 Tax=Nyssa sinensis TaxID=561372 RepID=A0A5J5BUM7_9ASTE|nr:hypothetical protein F0562_002845 [Nyssa sinensis]
MLMICSAFLFLKAYEVMIFDSLNYNDLECFIDVVASIIHNAPCTPTAKYASSFYGPFCEALDSNPRFGDKKTYQMNPTNYREALVEACEDESAGADILLVKPGLPYLDIIRFLQDSSPLPISAYQVLGEYSMIKAGGVLK